MDSRGFGSGYSSWGGGGGGGGSGNGGNGNRGSGGYDSMSGLGGYGSGGHMKRCLTGADAVIAKINQRLDMLTQLEGGFKGSRCDRFDQYESFDSRPSGFTSSRDLYRSGGSSYGFGDAREDNMPVGQRGGSGFGEGFGLGGGGGFGSPSSSYGVAKMRQNMRESFTSGQGGGSGGGGGGWAGAGRRSPRRGGSGGVRGVGGGYGSRRPDPTPIGGGGRGGGGRGKLPSLLSNRMYPESGGFHQGSIQGPQDFPGRHFGGGPRAGRQRGRKRPLNKQVKPQHDMQKKRKQSLTAADEPESKINRMEGDAADAPQEQTEKNGDDSETNAEPKEANPAVDAEKASPKAEEKKVQHGKQSPGQNLDKHPKMRKRRGFLERVMFACSVCKFRSFYKEEMEAHLDSRFHKDHFKFLSGQLSKPTTDFLQEYLQNKFKKTEQRVSQMENHSAAICQMYREQDLTKELSMEHFMRKVEAAHCAACDLFIPMQPHLIQKHIKSPDHNYNRKGMMEQSKRASLSVARSILNHKLIGKKLESYLKGENPFSGNQDDQDPEDSMVIEGSEQELISEAAGGETVEGPVQPEGEAGQEEFEGEAPAATGADEEKIEEEQGTQGEGEEVAVEEEEQQDNQEEDEGFEIGGEEEGYVVQDEIGEEGLHIELEDEGLEVAEEEEKNDE
ncbi:A-kinase anchor protein 8-like isoform X1 [Takifugu rubripes]|uniref:A kinase (PRKA) anchor protein 8-like n=1 Tax=Takifugu rubripes TaxID=31033 RepID=H2UVP2_TAKRU|nr:A-kinase anchor protein 8-like isoform X1 [Takifugu rubripes]